MALIGAPLYLAALAARPAPAVQETLPAGLVEPAGDTSGDPVELPTTPPIRVRAAAGGAIETAADGFVEGADLLLYWASAEGAGTLADAHLLGAFRGGDRQRFALPEAAAGTPGTLILYSLGHGEELARASWPAAAESAP